MILSGNSLTYFKNGLIYRKEEAELNSPPPPPPPREI